MQFRALSSSVSPTEFWTRGSFGPENTTAAGLKGDDATIAHILTQGSEISKRKRDEKSRDYVTTNTDVGLE